MAEAMETRSINVRTSTEEPPMLPPSPEKSIPDVFPHQTPHKNGLGSHSRRPSKLLKHQLRMKRIPARNENFRESFTIDSIEEDLSFDKGFFLFIRALQMLVSKMSDRVVIVGLAGPSGAGKTVFSQKIRDLIPGCVVLSMDMYNDASRLVDGNFDDPRLTDYDLLVENIEGLRRGMTVKTPIYDFKTSTRIGYNVVKPPSSRIVVIEGIYALSSRLREKMDLRVSINGGVHFDLVKRVLRDIDRSGQQPAEIIQQISETVYPMYKAFIEPDLKSAQIRIYNEFNPFAGFQNPTYTLKVGGRVTESRVKELLPDLYAKREESEFNDIYLLPPSEDPETCNSWLRMRNKNGKYKLMFEEWVKEGDFIISPGISFEVSVKILGGLLALGYSIYLIMPRKCVSFGSDRLKLKWDSIAGVGDFLQIQGNSRAEVAKMAKVLEFDGYIPYPYIEQVQLRNLTQQMRDKTEDLLARGQHVLPGLDPMVVSPIQTVSSPRKALFTGDEEEPAVLEAKNITRSASAASLSAMATLDVKEIMEPVTDVLASLLESQKHAVAQIHSLSQACMVCAAAAVACAVITALRRP